MIREPVVLAPDVVCVPITDLPEHLRAAIPAREGDHVLTRPGSRDRTRVIGAAAARFLEQFRHPTTILDAVLRHGAAAGTPAEQLLDESFPLLQALLNNGWLAKPGTDAAEVLRPVLEPGERFAGWEVVRCVQVLEDAEIHEARDATGRAAALKLWRGPGRNPPGDGPAREAAILSRLNGSVSPWLFASGVERGREFLAIEWVGGEHVGVVADRLRGPAPENRAALLRLAVGIATAYARLHAQQVLHGDVHPRNILVAADGSVRLVDFGLARLLGDGSDWDRAPRGGIGFFAEPELAARRLRGESPPQTTPAGEQYSLAALLYFLITGHHTTDFSLDKPTQYRQVADEPPMPFAHRSLVPWPEVERCLARALRKVPAERFASVAGFAAELAKSEAADCGMARPPHPPFGGASRRPPPQGGRSRWMASPLEGEVAAEHCEAAGGGGEPVQEPATGESSFPGRTHLEQLRTAFRDRFVRGGPRLWRGPIEPPRASVKYGAAGVAFALYRMAVLEDDAGLLALADGWSVEAVRAMDRPDGFANPTLGIGPETVGNVSLYHSPTGVFVVQALLAHAREDVVTWDAAVHRFVEHAGTPSPHLDLALGRAGVLLGATLLREAVPDDATVTAFGNRIRDELRHAVSGCAPIREDHRVKYLWIAHGWAGILYAVLRWDALSGRVSEGLGERLEQLAASAEPAPGGRGLRWPRRGRGKQRSEDYLPGWCHGTAGHVFLWSLASRLLRDDRFAALADAAARNARLAEDGMTNLCCGLAGRAYALLHWYKHTGEREWLVAARELGEAAAIQPPDGTFSDVSLYKGRLGVALLAEDLNHPEWSCMPLFEGEGWPG